MIYEFNAIREGVGWTKAYVVLEDGESIYPLLRLNGQGASLLEDRALWKSDNTPMGVVANFCIDWGCLVCGEV